MHLLAQNTLYLGVYMPGRSGIPLNAPFFYATLRFAHCCIGRHLEECWEIVVLFSLLPLYINIQPQPFSILRSAIRYLPDTYSATSYLIMMTKIIWLQTVFERFLLKSLHEHTGVVDISTEKVFFPFSLFFTENSNFSSETFLNLLIFIFFSLAVFNRASNIDLDSFVFFVGGWHPSYVAIGNAWTIEGVSLTPYVSISDPNWSAASTSHSALNWLVPA